MNTPHAPAAKDREKAPQNKGAGNGPREQFVTFFLAGAEEANRTEYEAGIPQALRLMNANRAANPQAAKTLAKSGAKPAEVIEQLYLATVSRRPTADETARLTAYVSGQADAGTAYGDVLWALVNSSEFTMVR